VAINESVNPEYHQALVKRSVQSILRNQETNGAIVASPDFQQYRFCWLRDGSFSALALDLAGEHEAAARYHSWVSTAVNRIGGVIDDVVAGRARGESVDPFKMPPARFTLDGSVVIDGWPNFQIDGYGTWLWSLGEHLGNDGADALDGMRDSVARVARYLKSFALSPCYDVWEESGTALHTSTLASVYAGLVTAARLLEEPELLDSASQVKNVLASHASRLGHYVKSSENDGVDASALWLGAPFHVVAPDDPHFEATVSLIEDRLLFEGGVRRYSTDTYFGSGAWPVLTASLGWHYAEIGDVARAQQYLDWVGDHFDERGWLGEQFGGEIRDPRHYAEWVERWGPPAADLTWSHAMYVILSEVLDECQDVSNGEVAAASMAPATDGEVSP